MHSMLRERNSKLQRKPYTTTDGGNNHDREEGGSITLSPPPSHRLGSKTGAGSWETIKQQKHGVRALLQSK
ncbi:hypothetical protein EYF80_041440 [Liparis tanakae]|uniref:Uncharacterized protein n=1 Tax=Liparis tanakae TaxID=230148 RepID=A0A4Z2G548_9TELE|nr:hypothetical protein EYF80_041440 [Liparis tanakae]